MDTRAQQPELAKLMQAAGRKEFECVLVTRIDRWTRSVPKWLADIRELRGLRIGWMAVNGGIDMQVSCPDAIPMLRLVDALLALEAGAKSERVRAGMRTAKRRGDEVGRPKLVFDREQVAALRAKGKSIRAIAAELGVGKGTVERLLLAVPKG